MDMSKILVGAILAVIIFAAYKSANIMVWSAAFMSILLLFLLGFAQVQPPVEYDKP